MNGKKPFLFVLVLALLFLISVLTWGKTVRVAKANRLLVPPVEPDGPAKARRVYEDLLVDQPRSPFLLHNLGLTFYRDGNMEAAAEHFQAAGEELGETILNMKYRRQLAHKFHYHQGNACFAAAENAPTTEEAVAGYQEALAHFQQAIKADPVDHDAKYNYELTLLRLKEAERETNPGQETRPEGEEDREDDPLGQVKENEHQENDEEKKSDPSPSADAGPENWQETGGKETDMSREEALSLLEALESALLYQGPLLPEAPPVGKDW